MQALSSWSLTMHGDQPYITGDGVMYALQAGGFVGTKLPRTEQLWSMGRGLWAVDHQNGEVVAQRWGGRRFEPVQRWPNEGIGAESFPGACHEGFEVGDDGKTRYEQWRGRRMVAEVADVFYGEPAHAQRFADGLLVTRHQDNSVHFAGKTPIRLTRATDRVVHGTVAGKVPYVVVRTAEGHVALRWLAGGEVVHRRLAARTERDRSLGSAEPDPVLAVAVPTATQLIATASGVRVVYQIRRGTVARRCEMHPSAPGRTFCADAERGTAEVRYFITDAVGPAFRLPVGGMPLAFPDRAGRLHVSSRGAYEVLGTSDQTYMMPRAPNVAR